jgi:two-component system chemotaxis response regulator CheY
LILATGDKARPAEDKNVRILIADESKIVRNRLLSGLAELGLDCVREADTSFNALVGFHEFKPELVILDTSMPGADGIEMLTRIKSRAPQTVVLMFSHFVDKQFALQCREAGAAGCFRKPEDFAELLTFVRTDSTRSSSAN